MFDDCPQNPCENGGTCRFQAGSFLCTCAPGFSGSLCQSKSTTSPVQRLRKTSSDTVETEGLNYSGPTSLEIYLCSVLSELLIRPFIIEQWLHRFTYIDHYAWTQSKLYWYNAIVWPNLSHALLNAAAIGVPCTASNSLGNSTVVCTRDMTCCQRETETGLPFAQCCPGGSKCGPYNTLLGAVVCLAIRKLILCRPLASLHGLRSPYIVCPQYLCAQGWSWPFACYNTHLCTCNWPGLWRWASFPHHKHILWAFVTFIIATVLVWSVWIEYYDMHMHI